MPKSRSRPRGNALGTCQVCDDGVAAKYRCPVCRKPYCSLACFKTHKSDCAQTNDKSSASFSSLAPSSGSKRSRESAKDDDASRKRIRLVDDSQLSLLVSSRSVRDAIKSERLQAVVREIVASSNPHKALRARLNKDPAFLEFGNKVLVAIGAVGESFQGKAQLELGSFNGMDESEDNSSDDEGRDEIEHVVDDHVVDVDHTDDLDDNGKDNDHVGYSVGAEPDSQSMAFTTKQSDDEGIDDDAIRHEIEIKMT